MCSNIARFTGAKVIGLNYNEYQVQRAKKLNAAAKLDHLTEVVRGDFMKLPFEDNVFDGVYAIEATCHAPDRVCTTPSLSPLSHLLVAVICGSD